MTEIVLNDAGIDALVCQVVAAAVPQHVGVDGEIQPGCLPGSLNDLMDRPRRQRRFALADEDVGRVGVVAPDAAQQSQLVAVERMGGGLAVLAAVDVDVSPGQIDLMPAQRVNFAHPQSVAVH